MRRAEAGEVDTGVVFAHFGLLALNTAAISWSEVAGAAPVLAQVSPVRWDQAVRGGRGPGTADVPSGRHPSAP